jgi:ribA/ribD-fused uncharacterized protein
MHKFAFLSNYARILPESPVTVEHLYQAAKEACPEDAARIMAAETPGDAKKMARKIKKVDNWDDIKLHIMFNLLLYKFSFEENKQKLLATGDEELCEGNIWYDNSWGDCHCECCIKRSGANYLGKLLMKVRELNRLEFTQIKEKIR